ncbi:bifunctional hydroxymethylpyrimidine kinase/phosphomethylpyrimidine kinase [Salinisphaera sp. RV14]|uniref:bifunctional hydroxymethylpyrimidine kinase/phosphomethylpyrimidine kinase n=1 Tax=unclassified Salinisphaera TaxID=2649847 RepID=UPI003F87FA8D
MTRPNVLILSGHDPSGGAGLHADIEAVAAQGAHGAAVITALTRQDTRNVYGVAPVAEDFFAACIDTLLDDMPFAAIKTGVLVTAGQVRIVAELAARLPGVPLVVDPVLVAAGGGELAGDPVGRAMRDALFAQATVITPNTDEARRLCAGETDIDRCGAMLVAAGCHALITGGDDGDEAEVVNRLYTPDGEIERYTWPRLAGRFHGSGCTLAASLAARLALGESLGDAVANAQAYTGRALARSFSAGSGQSIPGRWPGGDR